VRNRRDPTRSSYLQCFLLRWGPAARPVRGCYLAFDLAVPKRLWFSLEPELIALVVVLGIVGGELLRNLGAGIGSNRPRFRTYARLWAS
jgi:hypothetical protein